MIFCQNTTDLVGIDAIRYVLRCTDPSCVCQKGDMLHCPAHDDEHPSLSVTYKSGGVAMHCFAGCSYMSVSDLLNRLGVWGKKVSSVTPARPQAPVHDSQNRVYFPARRSDKAGLTLAQLAEAKALPLDYLRSLGLADQSYGGALAVRVPYADAAGNVTGVRYRLSLKTEPRFMWRKGDKVALYGDLADARAAGWVLLVEGESDCWTLWHHRLPAVGMPGKSTWRGEWAKALAGLDVYLWCEPDAWPKLPLQIGQDIPSLRVIRAPADYKDPSAAHVAGQDVVALVAGLRQSAVPVSELLRTQLDGQLAELAQEAAPVFAADDPLELVELAVRSLGYGGDVRQALIVYLAATSRVLALRTGGMVVHLILIGPPSGGKSFTVGVVLKLLPEHSYRAIDAGSPRALIYDEADLQHKVLMFGEADSLPAGEDNPAASAVRGLLQDGRLHYMTTVRDLETGDFTVSEVDKPGPTVLVTTAVKPLGTQLMTRLFTLEIADDAAQVVAALRTQAAVELHGTAAPDPALIAFQSYLQARAPWDVVVPFADQLAEAIARAAGAPRILRDFARLLSLVKSVAVLRHRQRRTDVDGRLVADLADYRTVKELVGPMYAASVSDGGSDKVRAVVDVANEQHKSKGAHESVTVATVAEALKLSKPATTRRIKTALAQGWLVNAETRNGRPWSLEPGERMPDSAGLPDLDGNRQVDASGCQVSALGRITETALTGRYTPPPPIVVKQWEKFEL